MRVLEAELAHGGAAHVHIEDAAAKLRDLHELAVDVSRLGEPHDPRLRSVGPLIDRHAPAGIVLLRLPNERILSIQELVSDRNRLRGDATENATHRWLMVTTYPGGRVWSARALAAHEHQGAAAQADLVGPTRQALWAGAPRRRGEEPSRRAPRRRDRLPAWEGRAHVYFNDEHAPQPRRVRARGTGMAPRAGRVREPRRGGARGDSAAAAPRAQAPRRGRGARQSPHGLCGGH